MANIRGIKKDIQFVCEIVISDAIYLVDLLSDDAQKNEVYDIIVKTADMHNELLVRVNHRDAKENPKAYYKQISTDLVTQTNEMFTALNKLMDTI